MISLGIAGAFDLDLRGGFDRAEVSDRQVDLDRADVFIQPLQLALPYMLVEFYA
jgi:hypothetical protein